MPKISITLFITGLLITGLPALAQSAFDGTWRLNTNDAQVNVTQKFLLKDGLYSCSACDPPIKDFKADGLPHKATGSPYYDAVTVRVIDDHTVEFTSTKNGKPAEYSKLTASEDNKKARATRPSLPKVDSKTTKPIFGSAPKTVRWALTKFPAPGSRRRLKTPRIALGTPPTGSQTTVWPCMMAKAIRTTPSLTERTTRTMAIRARPASR